MNRSPFTMLRGLLAASLMAVATYAAAQAAPAPGVSYFAPVPVGGNVSTTLQLFNFQSTITYTNIIVQVDMPPGFTVTSPAVSLFACTVTSTPSGTGIAISIPTLGPFETCYVAFDVSSSALGFFTTPVTYSTTESGTTTGSGKLTGYVPASASVTFSPPSVTPGATSTMSLTISNPDTNHFLQVDDGVEGPAYIPLGPFASATLTAVSPSGLATGSSSRSVPDLPFIDSGNNMSFYGSVAPGGSCTILVDVSSLDAGTFTVPQPTPQLGAFYSPIFDWQGFGAQIPLAAGTLNVGLAALSFTPARLDFPPVPPRASSGPLEAIFTNAGTAPVSILGIEVLGSNFAVTHNCLATLPVGESCSFLASFSGSVAGPYFGEVRVTTSAAALPVFLPMAASVTLVPMGTLTADPPRLAFDEQVIGTTSPSRSVTVSNSGDASALIGAISATGDFTVVGSTCASVSLAPGSTCTLNVAFKPTSVGTRSGQVTVPSNASNPVLAIGLTGMRQAGAVAQGEAGHRAGLRRAHPRRNRDADGDRHQRRRRRPHLR